MKINIIWVDKSDPLPPNNEVRVTTTPMREINHAGHWQYLNGQWNFYTPFVPHYETR